MRGVATTYVKEALLADLQADHADDKVRLSRGERTKVLCRVEGGREGEILGWMD